MLEILGLYLLQRVRANFGGEKKYSEVFPGVCV